MQATALVDFLTDSDTGLLHDAFFRMRLEEEFKKAVRFGWAYSLLLVDVDGLAELEAEDGSSAAAMALLDVTGEVLTASRDVDLSARLSGQRFGMLLPGTELAGARVMVERVMSGILDRTGGKLSLSVGITDVPRDGLDDATEFLARAERAVDMARGQGANQVVSWTASSA